MKPFMPTDMVPMNMRGNDLNRQLGKCIHHLFNIGNT